MTTHDHALRPLLDRLNERSHVLTELDRYYAGEQALAYVAPEARKAIGSRFGRVAVNIPRLAVNALAERLRVTGFARDGGPDSALWADWIANDLDQRSALVHREALVLGRSYASVWTRKDGSTNVAVESAHQVAVERDPGTREPLRAIKRWEDATGTNVVLYEPDVIRRFRADAIGAEAGYRPVDTLANPFGVLPIVEFANTDRLLTEGVSELTDVIPLVDALNKLCADMLVASEFYARPRRWATGIELEEDENGNPIRPFEEGDRMLVSEAPESKFGQLPGSELTSYKAAVEVVVSSIMSVSSLPSHYVGVLSAQPPSADALRASEASLTAKAEARQHTFGRSWEQVARLMRAAATGQDPNQIDVAVSWADPSTRSIAQEADAAVKLFSAGLLPASAALKRLGYADHEIEQIRAARRAEALDTVGLDLDRGVA